MRSRRNFAVMRCPTTLLNLSLVVALACLVEAGPTEGSTLLKFRLANEGSKPVSGVDFTVLPPGAIVPPVVGEDPDTGKELTGSPLTILPGSTGFDTDKFSVALGKGPDEQRLRLLFGQTQMVGPDGQVQFEPVLDDKGQPLGLFNPGAVLNFALNVDSAAQDALQLVLPDGVGSSLSLKAFAVDDPATDLPTDDPGTNLPPTDPGTNPSQIPEPAPLVLWSVLAALGFVRVHAYRRSRQLTA